MKYWQCDLPDADFSSIIFDDIGTMSPIYCEVDSTFKWRNF